MNTADSAPWRSVGAKSQSPRGGVGIERRRASQWPYMALDKRPLGGAIGWPEVSYPWVDLKRTVEPGALAETKVTVRPESIT